MRAAAFLVADPNGRRSIYLDEARAEAQASAQHGVLVDLVPGHVLVDLQERTREARGILPAAGEAMPADVLARLQVLLGEGA